MTRLLLCVLAALATAGCATTELPASLGQAKTLYGRLAAAGAGQRREVEGSMLRASQAIRSADSALAEGGSREYVAAMADIAIRNAQAAEAEYALTIARAATDSLRVVRLNRLLAMTQAQRDTLAARNQLSQDEVAALRNMLVAGREDSLRRQVDSLRTVVSAGEVLTDSLRQRAQADSLRRAAEEANRQVDSLRQAAERAARLQTEFEQQRSDSLRRAAQRATQEADSLRGVVEASGRQRDSLRAVAEAAGRRQDSIRIAQSAAEQAAFRSRVAENQRADSLRRVAERARSEIDSTRAAALRASRQETEAERQRSDSLRRISEEANRQLDSLRTAAEMSARQRDSLRTAVEASARQADSLRAAAEAANRARDSLRAEFEASQRLNAALMELRGRATGFRTLTRTERGLVIGLSDVLFDVGSSTLKPGAARTVRRIAQALREHPTAQISVEGHTDSLGRPERNQVLSEQRAEAVKRTLVEGGVDEGRIATQGLGAAQPVASNRTRAGRQLNRRVEIVILGAGTDASRP